MINKRIIIAALILLNFGASTIFATTNIYKVTNPTSIGQKFVEQDFQNWLVLLYKAKAFELFEEWIELKKISRRGVVLDTNLVVGEHKFTSGTIITIEDIFKYNPQSIFTGKDIVSFLYVSEILDANGCTQGVTEDYLKKFKTMKIPIKDPYIQTRVIFELYKFIVSTKQKTQLVEIPSPTFFEILNNEIDNYTSTFFKETLCVAEPWFEKTICDLKVGFAPYPNFAGHPGIWSINGNDSFINLQSSLMTTSRAKSFELSGKYALLLFNVKKYSPLYSPIIGYWCFKSSYLQIQSNSGTTHYGVISFPYGFGVATAKGRTTEMDFGLSYSDNSTGRSSFGFAANTQWEFPIYNWLGFTIDTSYLFNKPHWEQFSGTVGLILTPMSPLCIKVGYRWLSSPTDTNDEGVSMGVSYWH